MNGEEQLQLRSWIEQVQLKDHVATSTRDPNVGSALDKLQKGQSLDDAQANSLEALILQAARPALVVSEGRLEVVPGLWKSLEPARPRYGGVRRHADVHLPHRALRAGLLRDPAGLEREARGRGRLCCAGTGFAPGALMPADAAAPFRDASLSVDVRARDLLARMTLPEKLAQIVGVWSTSLRDGD